MTQRKLRLIPSSPPWETDDVEVLKRVAASDMHALGVLYDRYAPMLLRFARRLGGREDAEDMVQSVFLRVVKRAKSFNPGAISARPWLFAIAVHVAQERRRSLRRFATALSAVTSHASTTEAERMGERSELERCLAALSLQKRTVLLLFEVEGFDGEEIARMLSIPVGTVWTRLHHARRDMRDLWGDRS
ncbi:MAG: sigma-70 family RNA polymerase sigma factor [Myxococcales bacterium]